MFNLRNGSFKPQKLIFRVQNIQEKITHIFKAVTRVTAFFLHICNRMI